MEKVGGGELNPVRRVLEAQHGASYRLVVVPAALHLLRYGVHVAEAALEGVALEDGRSACQVIGRIDHARGALDRVRDGEALLDAVVEVELADQGGTPAFGDAVDQVQTGALPYALCLGNT